MVLQRVTASQQMARQKTMLCLGCIGHLVRAGAGTSTRVTTIVSGHHEGGESRCLEVSSGPAALSAATAAAQPAGLNVNPDPNPGLYARHGGQAPDVHAARTLSVDGDVILQRPVTPAATDVRCELRCGGLRTYWLHSRRGHMRFAARAQLMNHNLLRNAFAGSSRAEQPKHVPLCPGRLLQHEKQLDGIVDAQVTFSWPLQYFCNACDQHGRSQSKSSFSERRHGGEVSGATPIGRLRLARCQPGSEAQQFAMSASADRSLRIHPRSSPRLCVAARRQGAPGLHDGA